MSTIPHRSFHAAAFVPSIAPDVMPPKARQEAKAEACSESPSSNASPTQSTSPVKREDGSMLSAIPPLEVKQQKACVLCRRSKVKCIHDGRPPCKRCIDTNQQSQCKFRLRADDETWRERTDDILQRLGDSVDWLVQQQQQSSSTSSGAAIVDVKERYHRRSNTLGSNASSASLTSPTKSIPAAPHLLDSKSGSENVLPPLQHIAPQPSHQLHPPFRPSSTTYLGFDGAGGLLSPGDSQNRSATSPASPAASSYRLQKAASAASSSFRPLGGHPPPLDASKRSPLPPHHKASGTAHTSYRPPPLEAGQTRPSTIIHFVHEPPTYHDDHAKPASSNSLYASPYANPSHYIGRSDPRLTVISMGLTSMDQARHLFKFFARYLQPHCFGFPAYPANEHMTPLILACILMVSSMHEPSSRHLFDRFRHEAFSTSLTLDQPVNRYAPLDPELGIGVEEITGACIAACWLGGETAYKIARIARHWAIGYLEHFEVRSAQTLGEWMTILPPFRQIDLVGKLRIWLMSYITEAQQAVMQDKPSLIPESEPAHYCEGLLNASSHSAELGESFGNGVLQVDTPSTNTSNSNDKTPASGGGIGSFASDRQLVAHARMMAIILAGQEIQRTARSAIAAAKSSSSGDDPVARRDAVVYEATRMVERWREWLEELNRWRLLTSQYSELSESTLESIDLSLLYHLSRTFLASHPMDSELGILDETHHALKTASSSAPTEFSRLAIAQLRTISTAKHSALFALKLATTEFGEKLSYLPQFYHWLLGHAAGLLLLLVQRRETFLMAKEAESLLQVTEKFVQLYVFRVTSHSFHSAGASSQQQQQRGIKRDSTTAQMDGDDKPSDIAAHAPLAAGADPLNFQWPFMTPFAAHPSAAASNTGNDSASFSNDHHASGAEKHPALANAQALARALYHVKMQVQSLDVAVLP